MRSRAWRVSLIAGIAAVVVAVDQVTKTWALDHLVPGQPRHVVGTLNWLLTFNAGAAFALGRGVAPIVEAVVVVLVAGLVVVSGRVATNARPLALVALGLLVGGALGNLVDRVIRNHHGAVVDFIQAVHWWPIFNVADACITVGAILFAFSFVSPSSKRDD